jgi:hypothetical protein
MRPHPGCERPPPGLRNVRHNLTEDRAILRAWRRGTRGKCSGRMTPAYLYRPDSYNKAVLVFGPGFGAPYVR